MTTSQNPTSFSSGSVKFNTTLILLALIHAFDWATTRLGLMLGATEGNPLITQPLIRFGFNPTFNTIKAIGIFVVIPLAYYLYPKLTEPEQKIVKIVFTILLIMGTIVAINNVVVLGIIQARPFL